jgi:hypothetical protein
MLSATQQDIDTVCRLEKSDVLPLVAPNKGDDDDLGLFTLEVVNRSNSQ